MISKIGAVQSFTSKVYVSNYAEMKRVQSDLVNSKDFLNEIKKLEQNENRDSVTFTPDTDPVCSSILMSVSRKRGNVIKIASGSIDYSADIPKEYNELKFRLDNGLYSSSQKGQLVKYLI